MTPKYEYQLIEQGDRLLLVFNERFYAVSRIVYDVLDVYRHAESLDQMYGSIEKEKGIEAEKARNIMEGSVLPLFQSVPTNRREVPGLKSYWWTARLLPADVATRLAGLFKPLFGKGFFFLFFLLAAANVVLYNWLLKNNPTFTSPMENVFQGVIVYFLLFAILLCHELGHIAASSVEKLGPKEIGVGLYYVMPVMFVDFTEAWRLPRNARTKINLGGITMQLAFGILLTGLFALCKEPFLQGILYKLITVNEFIIIINLIPFFKFDGYWILSDLADIPNLLRESTRQYVSLFTKKSPFKVRTDNRSRKQKVILAIYSALRFVFMLGLLLLVFAAFFQSLARLSYFALNMNLVVWDASTVMVVLKHLLIVTILVTVVVKIVKSSRK